MKNGARHQVQTPIEAARVLRDGSRPECTHASVLMDRVLTHAGVLVNGSHPEITDASVLMNLSHTQCF